MFVTTQRLNRVVCKVNSKSVVKIQRTKKKKKKKKRMKVLWAVKKSCVDVSSQLQFIGPNCLAFSLFSFSTAVSSIAALLLRPLSPRCSIANSCPFDHSPCVWFAHASIASWSAHSDHRLGASSGKVIRGASNSYQRLTTMIERSLSNIHTGLP